MTDEELEMWCERFHDVYEAEAQGAGWETQERSRKPWADVPEANKKTMRNTVRTVLGEFKKSRGTMRARFTEWTSGKVSIDIAADTPEERIMLDRIHTLKRGGQFPHFATIGKTFDPEKMESKTHPFEGAASFDFELEQPKR